MADDMKHCPFCNELIRTEAVKCRYCGEWVGGSGSDKAQDVRQSSTSDTTIPTYPAPGRRRWFVLSWKSAGVAVLLALVLAGGSLAARRALDQGIKPGDVLYSADWQHGFDGWTGGYRYPPSRGWHLYHGHLRFDDTEDGTLIAPYRTTSLKNYAIEIVYRIPVTNTYPVSEFDTLVEANSVSPTYSTRAGVVRSTHAGIVTVSEPFLYNDPKGYGSQYSVAQTCGTVGWTRLRVEMRSRHARLLVNNRVCAQVILPPSHPIPPHSTNDEIGVMVGSPGTEIASFKVIALSSTLPPLVKFPPTPTPTSEPTATPTPMPIPTPSLPAGFLPYNAQDGTFSVDYPSSWEAKWVGVELGDSIGPNMVPNKVEFSSSSDIEGAWCIDIMSVPVAPSLSLTDVVQQGTSGLSIASSSNTSIADQPATIVRTTPDTTGLGPGDTGVIKEYAFMLDPAHNAWALWMAPCAGYPSDFTSAELTFRQMLGTFALR